MSANYVKFREVTVSGFSADANPNVTPPLAADCWTVPDVGRFVDGVSRGHSVYGRFVNVSDAEVPTASSDFAVWLYDTGASMWVQIYSAATSLSSHVLASAFSGKLFVQVTALNTVGASTKLQLYASEQTASEVVDLVRDAISNGVLQSVTGTGALSFTGGVNPAGSIAAASASVPGTMSAADFAKLATVPVSAGVITDFLTDEIDLTQAQTVVLVPPQAALKLARAVSFAYLVTQKDGTVTTGPTVKAGTNANNDNILSATVQSSLAGTALNVSNTPNGTLTLLANQDISATGYRLEITVGAALGTATIFKCRILVISVSFFAY